MKGLFLATFLLILVGCGKKTETIEQIGKDGSSCTAVTRSDGNYVVCDDGTEFKVEDGKDGKDGESCTVVETTSGADVTCGDTTVTIDDGQDGLDGTDGQDGSDAEVSPYSIVEIIDPCGDNPGEFDEVLLRLYDGTLIAYFESGSDRFLSEIDQGNYRTTDEQECRFSVNSELEVEYTLTTQAKRIRPSGVYEDYELEGIKAAIAPSTLKIKENDINKPQGLWAELRIGNLSYCYQSGFSNNSSGRTLTLKHSKFDMLGDCVANNDNVLEENAGVEIEAEEVYMRALNSGKKNSTHVTTTVEAEISVIK